jgi:wyosine [tRNA(Phe)-imidazoG37] synthetase (radical SAM superfamily)
MGMSLGIDPLSTEEKVCSFDCVYCQLGRTKAFQWQRREFVPTEEVISEIRQVPHENIDYYTFSGRGEPTLALNLGDMIRELKNEGREKIAVITNSSLIDRKDVQNELLLSDLVVAKLDGYNQRTMSMVDHPHEHIQFSAIIEGLKTFRSMYVGKLAVQIMFIKENAGYAAEIAKIVKEIGPDEVQINTPLRPSEAKPLGKNDLKDICDHFEGLSVISVYEAKNKEFQPFDQKSTEKRHGSYK